MKAILVLDEMPKGCNDCPLYQMVETKVSGLTYPVGYGWCSVDGIDLERDTPLLCPLKSMPEKMEELKDRGENHCEYSLIERLEYRKGWNACIEEIKK